MIKQYPFKSNYFMQNGVRQHYIDEGEGDVIFLIHGNPTWSFYYRNMIKSLSKTNRVIAIDHIGCGLSDKPIDYSYRLEQRVSDLDNLINSFNLESYSMMVHDWGGAIGFGHAVNHVGKISKMIILNTAAFRSPHIPFTIKLCKLPYAGAFIVKYFNAFCYPATFMTTVKKLPRVVKDAYLLPYNSSEKRIAISEFVQDIPLNSKHRSYDMLHSIEKGLPSLNCDKLILWGGKDFCFHDKFYQKWREVYPDAQFKYYQNAGHYVIEDEKEDTIEMVEKFLGA